MALSIPTAASMLAVSELTRVPFRSGSQHLAAIGALSRSAIEQLAPSVLTFGLAALALMMLERGYKRAARAGLLTIAVAHAFLLHLTLADHAPFAWHPAVIALSSVVALGSAALLVGLTSERLDDHKTKAVVLGFGVVLIALLLGRGHYHFFVGQYPALHAWCVRAAFLGTALGLAFVFCGARPAVAPSVALLALPLVVMGLFTFPGSAEARPALALHTELGREASVAAALVRDGASLRPTEPPEAGSSQLRASTESPETILRSASMPELTLDLRELNLLFIVVEAMRFDRTRERTPSLGALAARGIRFERAYAPANGTFASMSAILSMRPTSFCPIDIRPRFWRGRLRDEVETAPEAMRAAGRTTFWVGHDHRGCFSDRILGLDQGFERRTLVREERDTDPDTDAAIADAAIETIGGLRPRPEPWFGLVFFVAPHDAYLTHDESLPHETELERYDQELAYVDRQLGRVLDAVDFDSTVVVVTGDHGEAFGEHDARHHLTTMFDEQIHVPLVVSIPGRAPDRVSSPVSSTYVLPWLLMHGQASERAAAERALTEHIGPMLRETSGAVVSEMIGRDRQEAALIYEEQTLLYDVFANVTRVFDHASDPNQEHDVREAQPDRYARATERTAAYRAARFSGQRFRFHP